MPADDSEFSLIEHYFKPLTVATTSLAVSIGDDTAVLNAPAGTPLCLHDFSLLAEEPGHSLSINSIQQHFDQLYRQFEQQRQMILAYTIALTMPAVDHHWLDAFSSLLVKMHAQYNMNLVGGDTTRGPWSLTVHAIGYPMEQE